MSAETLRKAAALMRERAEDAVCAIGDVWRVGDRSTLHTLEYLGGDDKWRNALTCGPCEAWSDEAAHGYVGTFEETAYHVASWHPAVAFAVADWLEAESGAHIHVPGSDRQKPVYDMPGMETSPALAVARAYLGESA